MNEQIKLKIELVNEKLTHYKYPLPNQLDNRCIDDFIAKYNANFNFEVDEQYIDF
jgi:hypothetical protein